MFYFLRGAKWRVVAVAACEGIYHVSDSVEDSNRKFNNLNLNDHQKCFEAAPDYSNNIFINKFKYDDEQQLGHGRSDNIIARSRSKCESNHCLTVKPLNVLNFEKDGWCKDKLEEQSPFSRSGSSLLLHIPAYENSIQAKQLPAISLNDVRKCFQLSTSLQDPFEYARQINDGKKSVPEIMEFKASQKLIGQTSNEVTDDKTAETQDSPADFFTNAVIKMGTKSASNTPTSSRKNPRPSLSDFRNQRSSIADLESVRKKPRFHIKNYTNQITNSTPLNPHQLENIRLNEVIKDRDEEIEMLRRQLKEANIQAKKNEKHFTSNYSDCGDRRQRQIVQDEFDYLKQKFGESAPEIISKLNQRFGDNDIPVFGAALTGHIFQSSTICLNQSRKLRHEFNIHGAPSFLASERKVGDEKKRIRAGINFEEIFVKLKVKAGAEPEMKSVHYMKDVEAYVHRRLQQMLDNDLYREIIFESREEIWLALTIDKAKDRTICGMLFGNTLKRINSAYNMAFLGIFEADDSPFNLYAAFQILFKIIENVKTVTLRKQNGDHVTIPIRYFYVADYKSEKAVAGLKSGNPTFPSINCLSKMKETYGEIDLSKKCPPRPVGCHEKYSQERPPLASFIPSSHFIPPPLHMTLGPGAALFDHLFEVVAKIDVEKGNTEQFYHLLKYNPKWKKDLRSAYTEISKLEEELKDIQETGELYSSLFSSSKVEKKLKPCSMDADCVVKLLKKNVPSHFVTCCDTCSKTVHQCCMNEDLSCPHCIPFKPTMNSGVNHLMKESDLINERIAEVIITISEKEILLREEIQKVNPGPFTKKLEKVLASHGASKQAFFQAFSGTHLVKMGNKLKEIIDDLPSEIKNDQRITVVFGAIRLFFNAKKAMKKELNMTDTDINEMKERIHAFGTYMKDNLPSMKIKQKGHLFLFEAPEFAEKFKTSSFFSDEAIESYHPIANEEEKRIKCKESPKRYSTMLKWGIDHNYYYDNIDCKSHEDN